MSTPYSYSSETSPRVQELPTVTATALKNSTADILDQLTAQPAIAITKHDKPRAVLLSIEQYEQLLGSEDNWLTDLHKEYQGMLGKMQEPEQKEAALRAFNASPEELGAAAVAAARRRK